MEDSKDKGTKGVLGPCQPGCQLAFNTRVRAGLNNEGTAFATLFLPILLILIMKKTSIPLITTLIFYFL